jgi:drug/metabolite transporter (DMT)-like permease
MLNPLKWKRVDQARLLFAVAFGALLGFTAGSRDLWFNILCALVGAVLWAGGFIIIGLLGSTLMPRRFPAPWMIEELNDACCFVVIG